MSRIEQIITEIEEYIDNCRPQAFSGTKIIVNKEEMQELLVELRMRVPDEIKKYQKIISNQDAILADASAQAQHMIDDAQAQIDYLVSDHSVTQAAEERSGEIVENAHAEAERIIGEAMEDAENIRNGAMQYADGLLAEIQQIVSGPLSESRRMFDDMFASLSDIYSECTGTRSRIGSQNTESYDNQYGYEPSYQDDGYEDSVEAN